MLHNAFTKIASLANVGWRFPVDRIAVSVIAPDYVKAGEFRILASRADNGINRMRVWYNFTRHTSSEILNPFLALTARKVGVFLCS